MKGFRMRMAKRSKEVHEIKTPIISDYNIPSMLYLCQDPNNISELVPYAVEDEVVGFKWVATHTTFSQSERYMSGPLFK